MPDPSSISLKTFMDASEINDGNTTLDINKDGNLLARFGSATPSAKTNAKTLAAFMSALTENFGSKVATAASAQFKADFGANRPLTGRIVQSIVNEAKFCIERNATVRAGFFTPNEKTGKSDFDNSFEARITAKIRDNISPEQEKELKGRIMTELFEKFHSKSRETVTVEAMKSHILQESPLLQKLEQVCVDQKPITFSYRNADLNVCLDQRGMLIITEPSVPQKADAPWLRDPAPGIDDPQKGFTHFLSHTPLLYGFSPTQAKQFKAELTAEFKTLTNGKNAAEARVILTEFANNQRKSQTLDILQALSQTPCRGFPGTKDEKATIARLLYNSDVKLKNESVFAMQVAMEHLTDITKGKQNAPITKETIWQGVFNKELPKRLNHPFEQEFRENLMPHAFPPKITSTNKLILHSLISSSSMPNLLHNPQMAITEKNLHTLKNLSVNSLLKGTDAMAADLHRRGLQTGVPSTITVGELKMTAGADPQITKDSFTLTVGTEPKLNGKDYPIADKNSYVLGQNSEVTRHLSEAIHSICGRDGRTTQREMVETLCSQSGLLPFTRMRNLLGFAITEHSPSNITIIQADQGAVRVHIVTPKTIPGNLGEKDIDFEVQNGSIDVSWLVAPDGNLSIEQLTIIRPGADAEQRLADLPVADVVAERIAGQASGLSQENRDELTKLVLESIQRKAEPPRDPLAPSNHIGPLMHLVTGLGYGLFSGTNANENYTILQRFHSITFPVGLLLDAAARASQAQAGGEITREALWKEMYPDYMMPPCTSDSELVQHMENSLPTFITDVTDDIIYERNQALQNAGKSMLTGEEYDLTKNTLGKRLKECLNSMTLAAAKEFVTQPHILRKEHLLTHNMAAGFTGLNHAPGLRLLQDIPRRGTAPSTREELIAAARAAASGVPSAAPAATRVTAIPTLSINGNMYQLGDPPKRNNVDFFTSKEDLADYNGQRLNPFIRELLGEIRTLCGGRGAAQVQVEVVSNLCAQNGVMIFRLLHPMADFNFSEHDSTNITVSAKPDGIVRVHISTPPEEVKRGTIAYSILVDRAGNCRVDDFIACPAGVEAPQAPAA